MWNQLTAFGQSSNSPFGSQSVFGQANNASSNPFTPKPFGSTTPLDSQTGGSIFGGTSSGVFGATQSSSPLTSTPTFGSSMPTFGASLTPAFGASSSSIGSNHYFPSIPFLTVRYGEVEMIGLALVSEKLDLTASVEKLIWTSGV
ncbi:hypothetical protein CsSME_00007785 [Camellia sinensis var. sinensis]